MSGGNDPAPWAVPNGPWTLRTCGRRVLDSVCGLRPPGRTREAGVSGCDHCDHSPVPVRPVDVTSRPGRRRPTAHVHVPASHSWRDDTECGARSEPTTEPWARPRPPLYGDGSATDNQEGTDA